ncbi:MAG: hypothetical protein ABFD18_07720 [Syntrophomonas sp.]
MTPASEPVPPGTTTARIIFSAAVPYSQLFLLLDQVVFARVLTDNLIVNPSFENGLNDWTPVYITLVQLNDVYEGFADAGIGNKIMEISLLTSMKEPSTST